MTDQQRGDALGIEGHPHLQTPNLDWLAQSGARFRRAYSECPTCIPARRCLMTGQKPGTNGVAGFAVGEPIHTENTLPELLRRAGYQTASIGRSMHQYPAYKRYGFETVVGDPFQDRYSGFQQLYRCSTEGGLFSNWPHLHGHSLGPNGHIARPWPHDEHFHETNYAINKALEFIDNRDKSVPFFMYVGTVAPHPPLVPPQCYYDRYVNKELDEPVVGDWVENTPGTGPGQRPDGDFVELKGDTNRYCKAGYYGLINHFDDQLYTLLHRLQMEDEPTYILFTSDHGEMLGDHRQFRKSRPFEGSARVPMILHGPGIPAQTVIDRPVALMDILPTFMDLAGLETPDTVDGISLLRQVQGQAVDREMIHGEHATLGYEGNHYLTDGHCKYIWLTESGTELFFDLETDPRECRNLLNDPGYAGPVALFRQALVDELAERPEGFVKNGRLQAGCTYKSIIPRTHTDSI